VLVGLGSETAAGHATQLSDYTVRQAQPKNNTHVAPRGAARTSDARERMRTYDACMRMLPVGCQRGLFVRPLGVSNMGFARLSAYWTHLSLFT